MTQWMKCYWCEAPISKTHPTLRWMDEYESAECEFHPASFDITILKTTHESAPHQTVLEVHRIVAQYHHNKQAIRFREPLRAVDDNVVLLSKKASRTSRSAGEKILPHTGTLRRRVHDLVLSSKQSGLTDEELEKYLGGKHQSVSASRRSLVLDGYIVDSGKTKKNAVGNDCILWIHTDQQFSETLFNHV